MSLNKMEITIPQYLEDSYATKTVPGKKNNCPKCNHQTLFLKKDQSLAKCFHPICGWSLTQTKINSNKTDLNAILQKFFEDCHSYLISLKDDKTWENNPYEYLLTERSLHEQVIEDSMLGAVQNRSKLKEYFEEATSLLKNKITEKKEKLFTKKGPKNFENIEKQIQYLQQQENTLFNLLRGKVGWLCFFYTDHHHGISSIKFRQPYSKKFVCFKPFKNAGVFNHHLFSDPDEFQNSKAQKDFLIFEGEFNSLQLQSLAIRLESGYFPCCSIGGVLAADWQTLKKLERNATICYDNDLNKAGFELVTKAREHFPIWAFTTPQLDSDADDFLKSFGNQREKAYQEFQKLLLSRIKYPRNYESLETEVDLIRLQEGKGGLKTFQVSKEVSQFISSDLQQRGKFYFDSSFSYYFNEEDKILVRIEESSEELKIALKNYGLNSNEKLYYYVVEELRLLAKNSEKKVTIHKFAYYNKKTNTLYLFNNLNQIYKITVDTIELVDNGTDGVLFILNRTTTPFKLVEIEEGKNYLKEYLIDSLNFDSQYLTRKENELLLLTWAKLLFFESLCPTKPIATFIGQKGSAKTSFLRCLGQILFGSNFNVAPISDKERDFDAMVINNYLACIDNADSFHSWINDKLACVATGQKFQYRPLFKNPTELLEIEPHCFLGITARTPKFTRDDVVDRLLIFRLKRLKGFKAEEVLQKRIKEKRNKIMSFLIKEIQNILKSLAKPWNEDELFSFRMADFAAFAFRINDRKKMETILEKLNQEQTNLVSENEPLFEILEIWVESNKSNQWFFSSELCKELKQLAEENKIKFKYNARSFGTQLNNLDKELEQQNILIDKRILDGKKQYYITKEQH